MNTKYQPVKKSMLGGETPAESLQPEPALSPHLAFVVQFRVGAGKEPEYFAGRAEHMVSGRTVRFHTREELLVFIMQMLTETPTP